MIDYDALAARLEAQDRLIATLCIAVLQAPVVTKDGLIAAIRENADRATAAGHHQAATILRYRIRDLQGGISDPSATVVPFPGPGR
jgi:hypothetical protein